MTETNYVLVVAHPKALARQRGEYPSIWGKYSPEVQEILGPFTRQQAETKGQHYAEAEAARLGTKVAVTQFHKPGSPLRYTVEDRNSVPVLIFQVCQVPCVFHAGVPFDFTLERSKPLEPSAPQ